MVMDDGEHGHTTAAMGCPPSKLCPLEMGKRVMPLTSLFS